MLQVIFALKNKTINFYFGIVSVLLYTVVFYQYTLYAESILNLYYFVASILGIIFWQKRSHQSITLSNPKDYLFSILVFIVAFGLLSFVLKNYTQSNVPYWDALVSAIAWSGTWLLLRRKLENWLVLNISNLIAIPLQYQKGLVLTALLTCIYVVIAIMGYVQWKKEMKEIH